MAMADTRGSVTDLGPLLASNTSYFTLDELCKMARRMNEAHYV